MNKEMINKLKNMNVNIVAVSKYHSKEEIDAVAKEGLITFGENRVQEFLEKYDPKYKWHIIGHLQTNKVKYIIGKVEMIESLDSIKLAKEIEKQAAKHDAVAYTHLDVYKRQQQNRESSYRSCTDYIVRFSMFFHKIFSSFRIDIYTL